MKQRTMTASVAITLIWVFFWSWFFVGGHWWYRLGSWAWYLTLAASTVIVLALLCGARLVIIGTTAGYFIGLAAGILFHRGAYQLMLDGEYLLRYNDAEIWLFTFLAFTFISVAIEILQRVAKKRRI